MRRGQITIFIVLGMVILIIFGLVFFVSRQTSDVVLEKKINKIYGDFLSSTNLKDYISSCLDSTMDDSMRLVALQGGRAYDYQAEGGYSITSENETIPFNHSGFIYNISYGIKKPIPGSKSYYLGIPQYPYPGALVQNPRTEIRPPPLFQSVFALREIGKEITNPHSLVSLCNHYGPNYYDIPNASYTCETTTLANISVQQYLKELIINRTRACVNFPQFTENTKYNISEGKIDGFVLLGNDDLFVNINYPIIISVGGEPPITKFLEFKSRPKTRLKKVHELAAHLIGYSGKGNKPKADADNIFFNITRDDPHDCFADDESPRQPCVLNGMKVSRIRDYCLNNSICGYLPEHYKYSDIINITDSNSMVAGKPLMFLFVVENRVPALNFISDRTINVGDNIEFFALDPDEDDLNYSVNNGAFEKIGKNRFRANNIGNYNVRVSVSDNEGLYDYQDVDILVI